MKTTKTKRIFALMLTLVMVFSIFSITSATAFANEQKIENREKDIIANVDSITGFTSPATDAFIKGASTFINAINQGSITPYELLSGLYGTYKSFYTSNTIIEDLDAIYEEIKQLSVRIDQYHNEEMNKLDEIALQQELTDFFAKLNSIVALNKLSLTEITARNPSKDFTEAAYQKIIDKTINNYNYTEYFIDLSTYIATSYANRRPAIDCYIDLLKKKGPDAKYIQEQCNNFNETIMVQYTLAFTNLSTGLAAEVQLAKMQFEAGKIDQDNLDDIILSAEKELELYIEIAEKVTNHFIKTQNTIKNLQVCEITDGTNTTVYYSFADALIDAINQGKKIRLLTDIKGNLGEDIFRNTTFKDTCFNNGSIKLKNKEITIDLNGFTIANTLNSNAAIICEDSTLNIISTNGKGTIAGINSNGSHLKIENVVITGGPRTGIYFGDNWGICKLNNVKICGYTARGIQAGYSDLDIKNCEFCNNSTDKTGGALYSYSHRGINIDNTKFHDNFSSNGGGAIYSCNTITTTNCEFYNNSTNGDGGAIKMDYYGNDYTNVCNLTNCNIHHNTCNNNGGGVYADSMTYLNLENVTIRYNQAGKNGGGLFCSKGSGSSCDPWLYGTIIITDNTGNGKTNNAFLQENTTSKCIFHIDDGFNGNSKIGVTSNTSDSDLDIVKCHTKNAYNAADGSFFYDNNTYRINRYTHWYSEFWWVEIVKN